MSQKYLVFDYETYSECDLKKAGGAEYAAHPTTEIMCVSWALGTREELPKAEIKSWFYNHPEGKQPPNGAGELISSMLDPSIILVAHNAGFEQWVTRHVFARCFPSKPGLDRLPPERFICTAALAAALALPRNLEDACLALKLPVQKDMEGNRLVKKWCKPRKATKNNPSTRHADPKEFERIVQYCEQDIRAEIALFLRLPPLTPREREAWLLDQKINQRGFKVDRKLIAAAQSMIHEETKTLDAETYELTGGELSTTRKREATSNYLLEVEGVFMPNMQKKTIGDFLREGVATGRAKRLLEIRQSISKSSNAKWPAVELRSRFDGRARDTQMYHGASTGRDTGKGFQPHNLPRGTIKDTHTACELIYERDLELIRMIYGDPMEAFSSCLRGVIIADEGKELFCSDFAAIETRVLFWLADHEKGLNTLRSERDIYKEMAAVIYNVKYEDVTTEQRQLGKKAILGLGYQMGDKKFLKSCLDENIFISEALSKKTVELYRRIHSPVPQMWYNVQRAAMGAILNPTKRYRVNNTLWFMKDDFLWCELPSGRRLAYYKPEIRHVLTDWGEKRPTIFHWSVDPETKKWGIGPTYGGKLTENVVQAVARDFMVEGTLRIEKAGYGIILKVHDEILSEREKGRGSIEEFNRLMSEVPKWGEGCPIKVEGFSATRYRK